MEFESEYIQMLRCFKTVTYLGTWSVTWDVWRDKSKNVTEVLELFYVCNKDSENNTLLTYNGKVFTKHRGTLTLETLIETQSVDKSFVGNKESNNTIPYTTPQNLLEELLCTGTVLFTEDIDTERLLELYSRTCDLYYTKDLQLPIFEVPTRTEDQGKQAILRARRIAGDRLIFEDI